MQPEDYDPVTSLGRCPLCHRRVLHEEKGIIRVERVIRYHPSCLERQRRLRPLWFVVRVLLIPVGFVIIVFGVMEAYEIIKWMAR